MDSGEVAHASSWPEHLRPGALRWARASAHYDDTIAFYREVVGLPVVGEFADSFGEDGTIFGLPDTRTQMEIVRSRGDERDRGAFDQLVLYLDDAEAVTRATARLAQHGFQPEPSPHPYWAANGAVTYRDPDGRDVVFAPWVYGRDPDPVDRQADGHGETQVGTLDIADYTGDRALLRPLFEEAEDSRAQLDSYIDSGRVLVARQGTDVVGHLQLVPAERGGEVELKNMAVAPERRGTGVGSSLVATAVAQCVAQHVPRLVVATAAADIGNLRFYQRCGFRLRSVERDAFTAETGYPDPVLIDGIPLLDRVWLDRDLRRDRFARD